MDFEMSTYQITQQLAAHNIAAHHSDNTYSRLSDFDQAKTEGNCICLTMCFYYIGKMIISYALFQELTDKYYQILLILVFAHDVWSSVHYLTLSVLIINSKFEDIFDIRQKVSVLSLSTSVLQIIFQELAQQCKPINGFLIVDYFEQKQFRSQIITLKLLYYFISLLVVTSTILLSEINRLLYFYSILLVLYWFIPISMSAIWGCLYVIFKIRRQDFTPYMYWGVMFNVNNLKEGQMKQLDTTTSENDCAICFQKVNETDTIIQLPCHKQHYFHADCCKIWLMKDGRCPLCRSELQIQPQNIRFVN